MNRPRRVLIFTDMEHTARRQMVQGIGRFAREGHHWLPVIPWADVRQWTIPDRMKVDGVIAYPKTREELDFLLGLRCPVVRVGPHFPEVQLPRIDWDDDIAGQMALDHLVGLGIKRLAFVGEDFTLGYVAKRLQGARRAAAKYGLDLASLELEPGGHRADNVAVVARKERKWLRGIKPPFGVIAATDITGFDLLNALHTAGITVPEEAAVVSIGGDNVLCPFSDPALSSVELPGERAGYEAARLLDRLFDKRKPTQPILVPPRQVVARRSSDVVASGDEMVRLALSYIREHACEAIGIRDVLAAVPLSRRPLELRFKRDTGRTLQKEIWRVRLERAKEMLVATGLPVAEIATRCGFSEPQRMTEVFGRELGIAPGAFRRSHRMAGGGE